MGEYLSTPNKTKHSSEGENAQVSTSSTKSLPELQSALFEGRRRTGAGAWL